MSTETPAGTAEGDVAALQAELEELRRRVEELESERE